MKTVRKDTGNRKVFVLLAIQGAAKFFAVFPVLRLGNWEHMGGNAALAAVAVFCIVWCIWNEFLERRLWNEQMFYENTVKWCKTGGAVTVYLCLVWFFTAQVSVFLRLSLAAVLDIWELIKGGDKSWAPVIWLPALTAVVVNSVLLLRTLCARIWEVRPKQYVEANLLWWAALLLGFSMTAGYRGTYAAASFYFAYNWQILLTLMLIYTAASKIWFLKNDNADNAGRL